jgi:hypothetical protein
VTHDKFLNQKVPLSERNQQEVDARSTSPRLNEKTSIFLEMNNQMLDSREGMIKFFKEFGEKKKRSAGQLAAVQESEAKGESHREEVESREEPPRPEEAPVALPGPRQPSQKVVKSTREALAKLPGRGGPAKEQPLFKPSKPVSKPKP